ncbi:MAG: 2Fe-2S iron-sulfur cluster binding domain-containing protein [Ghiorsea sp.]|nr:2Fe-2S iron-sulfur cluster binding domain-containing protein [Ghiorsea sp.]
MNIQVTFKEKTYGCDSSRPLLSTLLEQGAFVPYSCQGGLCQACMCKVTKGKCLLKAKNHWNNICKRKAVFYPASANLTKI